MNKIIAGTIGLFATVVLVAGSAYALFSDTAQISGISITSGNASLLIEGSTGEPGGKTGLTDNFPFPDIFTNLYPGYVRGTNDATAIDLWVKNDSASDIPLAVNVKISSLPVGWPNNLTYAAQMLIKDENSGSNTGWLSLPQWANPSGVNLTGLPINHNDERRYFVYFRIPLTYGFEESGYVGGPSAGTTVGDEIAGNTLTGAVFTVTGTQVL